MPLGHGLPAHMTAKYYNVHHLHQTNFQVAVWVNGLPVICLPLPNMGNNITPKKAPHIPLTCENTFRMITIQFEFLCKAQVLCHWWRSRTTHHCNCWQHVVIFRHRRPEMHFLQYCHFHFVFTMTGTFPTIPVTGSLYDCEID